MRKILLCILLTIMRLYCIGQNLTGDYAAFESLKKDVRAIADSCMLNVYNDSISIDVCWIEILLDSNGYICKAELVGNIDTLKEEQIRCIENSLLSSTNQYDIYIEDYHYFKNIYWKYHKYATYYIRYKKG